MGEGRYLNGNSNRTREWDWNGQQGCRYRSRLRGADCFEDYHFKPKISGYVIVRLHK